jgi:magnesium chelatase family protein
VGCFSLTPDSDGHPQAYFAALGEIMSLAVLMSRSLLGLDAPIVRVEIHLARGLPSFGIVGLADAEVRESRERVRAAIQSSGFDFPLGRLTVNL